jgi:hypothetical protein
MKRSIYFIKDPKGSLTFGAKPYSDVYTPQYASMKRPVSLKNDLGWFEKEHMQNILRKADCWEDFPAPGHCLVRSEFKAGEEDQRLDMLYLRDDASIFPAELKIGGTSLESHGQLIRYIADLHSKKINLEWLRKQNTEFLKSIDDLTARGLHQARFTAFLASHHLIDKPVKLLPKSGIIIDEAFPSPLQTAVHYLNKVCGFEIRLIQLRAYVADSWKSSDLEWMYRVDLVELE